MMAATADWTFAAAAAPVVLASASPTRAALLRSAGIPITIDAAAIDEAR
jgi:predicted house-cleaning NTP pyrophosphatase (Maf/HAM1 superfamily)